MKIKREENRPPVKFLDRLKGSIALKVAVLLVTFLAGALAYRSGVLHPVTIMIRQLIAGESLAPSNPLFADAIQDVENELHLYQNNGLPTLYIDLKFKYYQQLLEKRAEALRMGILLSTDDDFVPCEIHVQGGAKLMAEMRLKGDWTDHLQGDKWSFRIKLDEDGEVLHYRHFSLQAPETRTFLNEWAFHQNLMAEGILATRYEFVNVLLNGRLLGIYALEEHFTTQLLESQGRRAGVIIRFNEDLLWENRARFRGEGIIIEEGSLFAVTDSESASIDAFQASKIAADPVLSAEAETARDLLRAFQSGERLASDVFDVTLLGRYFALADLWGAKHAMYWHNWRFYYNPITGLLEPIGFDAQPLPDEGAGSIIGYFVGSGLFDDSEVRKAYITELARFTDIDYIENIYDEWELEDRRLATALKVEYSDVDVAVQWDWLRRRRAALDLELNPSTPVRGVFQAVESEPSIGEGRVLYVDLVNLMVVPVDVLRFELDGEAVLPSSGNLALAPAARAQPDAFEPVRFVLPLTDELSWEGNSAPEVAAVTRLAGLSEEIRVVLTGATTPDGLIVGPLPSNPTLSEALALHPFLSQSPDGRSLLVEPGVWDVSGDLVIPDGIALNVVAGSALRFEPGAILLVRGTLNLLGTANSPVLLTAQQDEWGGIVVLRAGEESLWKYASVAKTFGIERSGWILTGGITFFESPIRLERVLLGNNQTEDAINVIHSKFTFIESEFANTPSDAFDGDFAEGEIIDCYFHDIGGDAIDVSGTSATVRNTRIERITDKGISVGEQSTVTIQGVIIDTVAIGVASKDLSRVYINDTQISNASFVALAAYIKKPVYGPAFIEASDIEILDTAQEAIVQAGSSILLRGRLVPTVELDVDQLYEEGILGN